MGNMIKRVTNPLKRVTDPSVLSLLEAHGIDKDFVEFNDDYIKNPYSKGYKDLKSNQSILVSRGLPMRRLDDGSKITPRWEKSGNKFYAGNNLFEGVVKGTRIALVATCDQPFGVFKDDELVWSPKLFIGDVEYKPISVHSTLLTFDPINPDLSFNTLEWDYGVCKRHLRIIQGKIRSSWIFDTKPTGDIRISHDKTGKASLKLGSGRDASYDIIKVQIDGDVELIRKSDFDNALFPIVIGDSANFYPAANSGGGSVDGWVFRHSSKSTWTAIRTNVGTQSDDGQAWCPFFNIKCDTVTDRWSQLWRSVVTFDTSALGAGAIISAATIYFTGMVGVTNESGATPNATLVTANPATPDVLVNADYNIAKFGTTALAPPIDILAWNGSGSNSFVLNADGRANISKTGVSKFGGRAHSDIAGSGEDWVCDAQDVVYFRTAEAGTHIPMMQVLYTTPLQITEEASALIEVESEVSVTLDALHEASALIEVEALFTETKDLIREAIALLEMEAVVLSGITFPVSATVEVEAEAAATWDAISTVSATVEVEAYAVFGKLYFVALSGSITPTGALTPVPTFVVGTGGELDLSGSLSAANPDWLLMDDKLTWMGEWDTTWTYDLDDVVLHKFGNEWHVFVSKITHNVGNIPTSSPAAWRRLYQEPWL